MRNDTYNKKVLLYSGGMDSWLIDKLWKPDIRLYVDMNTRYSRILESWYENQRELRLYFYYPSQEYVFDRYCDELWR